MIRFFIVEDEIMIREGLSSWVDWASFGAELAGSAANGREGAARIMELEPDVVIADIVMPYLDGLDMVKILRQQGWDGDVIFLSAYQKVDYLKRAIRYEAVDYVFKPIDNQELLEVIGRAVERVKNKTSSRQPAAAAAEIPGEAEFLRRLDALVVQNIRTISINMLAKLMHLSRSNLIRIVKRLTGKTVNEWIIDIRVRLAGEQLQNSERSIEEISEAVGYRDIKYFCRLFRERTGCSPAEYRRNSLMLPRRRATTDGKRLS